MAFWTGERENLLKELADARKSAGQIGAALGCSRNAVIAKLHRGKGKWGKLHGQPRGNTRRTKSVQPKPAPRAVKKAAEPGAPSAPPITAAELATPIVLAPMPFLQAASERRCLFFACDPFAPASGDMPVCGQAVVNPGALPGKRERTHCAMHLRLSIDGSRCRRDLGNLAALA